MGQEDNSRKSQGVWERPEAKRRMYFKKDMIDREENTVKKTNMVDVQKQTYFSLAIPGS